MIDNETDNEPFGAGIIFIMQALTNIAEDVAHIKELLKANPVHFKQELHVATSHELLKYHDMQIESLSLPPNLRTRMINALHLLGVKTVPQLLLTTQNELRHLSNWGDQCNNALKEVLADLGLLLERGSYDDTLAKRKAKQNG